MFQFTFGDVGSGKSLVQADTALWLLHRSKVIERKYHLPIRHILSNTHFSQRITEKYKDRLVYWKDPLEMIFSDYPKNNIIRRDFDCIWDEMAVEIPSDKWKETDPEIRRFFAQHRKRGVQIYGNTQDYMMLDINARRMATQVFQTQKLIGNRDPSSTLPPVRFVWGVVLKWELDKQCIRQDDMDRVKLGILPNFIFITRKLVSVFNTSEDIYKEPNTLFVHRVKKCATCGYEKVVHT